MLVRKHDHSFKPNFRQNIGVKMQNKSWHSAVT